MISAFRRLAELVGAKGYESSIGAEPFVAAMSELGAPDDTDKIAFLHAVGEQERRGAPLGMSPDDVAHYTKALAHSGQVYDFDDAGGIVVAKHAPGGVAENTTGPVDCILAAEGFRAPSITGERLNHTGGTVEKFSSIPGFRAWPQSPDDFSRQINEIGVGIIGQTEEITPGDRSLYQLRDEHGEVKVLAHIVASILSKKLASGAKHVSVLLTSGRGAIAETPEEGITLGQRLKAVWEALGEGYSMSVTHCNMSRPLGRHIGNSLAIAEQIALLKGEETSPDLLEAVIRLCAPVIRLRDPGFTEAGARQVVTRAIQDGSALSKYRELLVAQGGDPEVIDSPESLLLGAEYKIEIRAQNSGVINYPDPQWLGNLVNDSLAGKFRVDGKLNESFDAKAGIVLAAIPENNQVQRGDLLATVHSNNEQKALAVTAQLQAAFGPFHRWLGFK